MVKKRNKIAEANRLLNQYGKMTIRQIYYKLVVKGVITNSRSSYNTYDTDMCDARRKGIIDPRKILDSIRLIENKVTPFINTDHFMRFMKFWVPRQHEIYNLDLWQSQPNYTAIFIEKDALARIVSEVAKPYQVPVIIARGNGSDSQLVDFIDYINGRGTTQSTIIQVYSDIDPEGDVIAGNIIGKKYTEPQLDRRLHAYKFYNFKTVQEGLLVSQVKNHKYIQPNLADKAKMLRDKNLPAFVRLHGNTDFYELDALEMNDFKQIIKDNIEKHIIYKKAWNVIENQINTDRKNLGAWLTKKTKNWKYP